MPSAMPLPDALRDFTVMPPLRVDLSITEQVFEGRIYYVVKDPVSLQYFRLTSEDYSLAKLFDGKRTFAQIRASYLDAFPHIRLDLNAEEIFNRISRFANDMASAQLVAVEGRRLRKRYKAMRSRKESKPWLYDFVNHIFFSRFSLFDPDELFGKMARPLWWIWTATTFWIAVAMIATATAVFVLNFSHAEAMLGYLFSIRNLALIWFATIVIKSIHELGHGLTCKHFGGEVHEVGVMILVFTPYFFVNVTDSWVMPNRKHRILVSAAGIYVELIIAALATFAWSITQPGTLQQFFYIVIVIASISTLLFNANPLMRFDGYYIMTDLMEVPNLQSKSRALIGRQLRELLLGKSEASSTAEQMALPKSRFWLFYTYAVLSWVYGYFVIYKLARFMAPHLAPFGLEGLANWFSAAALIAWVGVPIRDFVKNLKLGRSDLKPGGSGRRLCLVGASALCAVAALACIPRPMEIYRSLAVVPSEPELVRAAVSGIVREVYVKEGDTVEAGGAIALLENRAIERNFEIRKERNAINRTRRGLAVSPGRSDQEVSPSAVPQEEGGEAHAGRDRHNLVLCSQRGGRVLSRDLNTRLGTLLQRGDVFCEVAPSPRCNSRFRFRSTRSPMSKRGRQSL